MDCSSSVQVAHNSAESQQAAQISLTLGKLGSECTWRGAQDMQMTSLGRCT